MHSHKTNYVSVQNILLQSPIKYETEFSKKKTKNIETKHNGTYLGTGDTAKEAN